MSGFDECFGRLEEECDEFNGTTDEETALLEKIKLQHELLDTERKVSTDNELHVGSVVI